jgi:inner membrane protein
MDDAGYMEGYYSLFDDSATIQVRHYRSHNALLEDIEHQWAVKRLQWFTHGFYSVRRMEDDVVIADLRMGMEPFYVFQFKVGKVDGPGARSVKAITPKRVRGEAGWNRLPWIWQRIWTNEPFIEPSTTQRAPAIATGA